MRAPLFTSAVVAMLLAGAGAAAAAPCRPAGEFPAWLAAFKAEAAAQKIAPQAIAALDGVGFDPAIIKRDRGQAVFGQSFLQFSDRMISAGRLEKGRQLIRQNAALFAKIEQQYGVPAEAIASFWGLESDFGAFQGDFPTLQALATLAFDCRRPEKFRPQLMDALRVVQRGDLAPAQMKGAWAGELGQLQFMPSDYYRSAVDFDGDGRRDLIRSTPDALASAANLLASFGWQRGQPLLQEVRVPAEMPWAEADLDIQHSRAEWAKWGVTYADGRPLPSDGTPASLVLPMGRLGPAFLAYANFRAYLKWNEAVVYSTTAAYFAARLDGAPAARRGTAPVLAHAELVEVQRMLGKYGYTGEADGKIGAGTRAAVKRAQTALGLPADSWPTAELLARLRGS